MAVTALFPEDIEVLVVVAVSLTRELLVHEQPVVAARAPVRVIYARLALRRAGLAALRIFACVGSLRAHNYTLPLVEE